jgi:hypothetical protein
MTDLELFGYVEGQMGVEEDDMILRTVSLELRLEVNHRENSESTPPSESPQLWSLSLYLS